MARRKGLRAAAYLKKAHATGCHNPIFTLGIFSSVGTQNEPAWSDKGSPHQNNLKTGSEAFDQVWPGLTKFDRGLTKPVWLDWGPPHQRNLEMESRSTFPRVREGLTNFDQVWPRLTEALTRPKTGLSWPPPNHWIEHVEIFDSILYV